MFLLLFLVEYLFPQHFLGFHQLHVLVLQFCQQFYFLWIHLLVQLLIGLFWKQFLEHLVLYVFFVFFLIFSHEWSKFLSFNIFFCSWFYRISLHFYFLISNVKLTLSSICNAPPFWSVNSVLQLFKNTELLGLTFNR